MVPRVGTEALAARRGCMTLDLALRPDQQMLRDSVRRFLVDHARPGWRELSDGLGLGGVTIPESAGGFGGGATDMALVLGELGPVPGCGDWLSHAAAGWAIGALAPEHDVLAELASGQVRAAVVCAASAATLPTVDGAALRGTAALVAGAAEADWLLVVDDPAIMLVAARHDRVEQRHRIMHDGGVTADLAFFVEPGDVDCLATGERARRLAGRVNDMMLAARCAEAAAILQRMLADTIDYMGQRRQFGQPIAAFQVLRHRVADMQLALMKAAALTELAVAAVDAETPDRRRMVSAACVEIGDAVRLVGEAAVQIHGAMGLTDELVLGGHFKRALAIAAGLGSRAEHLARYAEAMA